MSPLIYQPVRVCWHFLSGDISVDHSINNTDTRQLVMNKTMVLSLSEAIQRKFYRDVSDLEFTLIIK